VKSVADNDTLLLQSMPASFDWWYWPRSLLLS